jgi:hypothetical protein
MQEAKDAAMSGQTLTQDYLAQGLRSANVKKICFSLEF